MLKADFHIHTNFIQKYEGKYTPKELIDKAKELGFDVIAITEHYRPDYKLKEYMENPLKTYYHIKKYADKKGILVLPGAEILIEGKEVLLLNILEDVRKYRTFQDLRKLKKKNKNVLIVAPHPFFKDKVCIGKELEKNIDVFDAIEYCHFYTRFFNFNKKAVKIAKKYSKTLLGTSDAHMFLQLNHTYTLIDSKKDINSIIKAIKENRVSLVSKPLPLKYFIIILFRLFRGRFLGTMRKFKSFLNIS